ncbi:hypothetical protein BLOT_016648 [Blomia tropicalis]|nr:hypothetical protein BLOT_016648 [Blomia tropicalis]
MSKSTMKNKISPATSMTSMSNFKTSVNYLWNTNAVLGKGATGAVYFGHNKSTGETVAVKCFNHLSHMRPYEVQKREFEVLKKVNHENIVRLLAIEEENDTKQKVLVMELCTGGSLFNILDDPLNFYGLEEKEFLLVLKHLAAGMKHLRDMNIIHRDLKPGNIMKFVAEDGTSIYKLTDFGAARELDDDQQFMSLYGTEEYLHPDMYERAVLRKPVGKSFKANVDLWSIGVTLFHIATGSLPFRPYGGRKNKETMYKITTEKASGIISGTQKSENGEILWSRDLPETCLLSASVQPLVTELLAGLLECDANKMWSFEKFFSSVTHILEHKVVFVYYVGTLTLYSIYCHISEKVSDLKSKFETMFKLVPSEQILVWSNDELNHIGSSQSNINSVVFNDYIHLKKQQQSNQSLPNLRKSSMITTGITVLSDDIPIVDLNTTENVPLFLINGQMNSKIQATSAPIPECKFVEKHNNVHTDVDAQYGKLFSSMVYTALRHIDKFVHNYKLACSIPAHVLKLIDKNIKLLEEKQTTILSHINILKERLENIVITQHHLTQFISLLISHKIVKATNIPPMSDVDMFKLRFDKIYQNIKSLTSSHIMNEKLEQLKDLWPTPKESENTRQLLAAQAKSKIYSVRVRESWLLLHKDKQIKTLNLHEEQLHQLEKIKLENCCKKFNELVAKEINPCTSIADKLEEWYQGAQVAHVKPQLIISELDEFAPSINELEKELINLRDEQRKMWNILQSEIKEHESERQELLATAEAATTTISNPASLINGSYTISSLLVKELQSLSEWTQNLKEAFHEQDQLIHEVESFTGNV